MHDEGDPSPSTPSLDTNPKLVLQQFARVRKAKNIFLGNGHQSSACPPFIDCNCLMPNGLDERCLLTGAKGVPYL